MEKSIKVVPGSRTAVIYALDFDYNPFVDYFGENVKLEINVTNLGKRLLRRLYLVEFNVNAQHVTHKRCKDRYICEGFLENHLII